jgi:methyl-accepting chemotaxis protein
VSAAARRWAHGDIAAGVDYNSRDEIGDVAAALRDVHATATSLVGKIRANNRAVRENRLEHRADMGGLGGAWSQLLAGMNDPMAAFAELQERREHAERETARNFEMSTRPNSRSERREGSPRGRHRRASDKRTPRNLLRTD